MYKSLRCGPWAVFGSNRFVHASHEMGGGVKTNAVFYKSSPLLFRRPLRHVLSLACPLPPPASCREISHTYASPAVKLLFTMVTELPCETMVLEMEAEGSASKDLAGAGGGSGAVTLGGGARTQPSMKATVRNADAVMVRICERLQHHTYSICISVCVCVCSCLASIPPLPSDI